MQEVRFVVCDYNDSKSVRYSSIFLTHCVKNAKWVTVWQLHKDQCQYAICCTPGDIHLHQQYAENPNSMCKMYT